MIAVASRGAKIELELDGRRYPVRLVYGMLVFDGEVGPETAPTTGIYREVVPAGALAPGDANA
jgi:hypothetical protein